MLMGRGFKAELAQNRVGLRGLNSLCRVYKEATGRNLIFTSDWMFRSGLDLGGLKSLHRVYKRVIGNDSFNYTEAGSWWIKLCTMFTRKRLEAVRSFTCRTNQ